jgi:hypothetical protein
MKPFVVGVSGPKDNGKSTLATKLSEAINGSFCLECHVEHVALPMYQMMAIFTGDDDFTRDPEAAKHKVYTFEKRTLTGTELLQDVAQRYAREYFGEASWVNLWKRRVSKHDGESVVFYPDCRMPQDREACDFGIWIESPGVVTGQNTNHITESFLEEMKAKADIHVVRQGCFYEPSLRDIASNVVVKYSSRVLG